MTAMQTGGSISAITVTNAGQNYTSIPTLIITNPGGTGYGAMATCELTETRLSFANPTQLNDITFPDLTGTVAVFANTGSLTVPTTLTVLGDAAVYGNTRLG